MPLVTKEDSTIAFAYIRSILGLKEQIASLKGIMRKPARLIEGRLDLKPVLSEYEAVLNSIVKDVNNFIYEVSLKHNYIKYYIQIHRSPAVLVFISAPPDVVPRNGIDPFYYIRYYFFTHDTPKKHKPLLAKFYMTYVAMYRLSFWRHNKKNLEETMLYKIYEHYYDKYVKYKNMNPSRAKRNAFRQAMRILIGNMYLIQILDLLREQAIKPTQNLVPRWLLENPEKADEMFNPIDLLPPEHHDTWRDYTWRQLLEYVK